MTLQLLSLLLLIILLLVVLPLLLNIIIINQFVVSDYNKNKIFIKNCETVTDEKFLPNRARGKERKRCEVLIQLRAVSFYRMFCIAFDLAGARI